MVIKKIAGELDPQMTRESSKNARENRDDHTRYSRNLEGEMPIMWANLPGNNRRPYFQKHWRIVILVALINRHTPHVYGRWKHTKSLRSTRSMLINIGDAGLRKEVIHVVLLRGSRIQRKNDGEIKAHALIDPTTRALGMDRWKSAASRILEKHKLYLCSLNAPYLLTPAHP